MGQVNFLFDKCMVAKILMSKYDKRELISEKLSALDIINSLLPIKENYEKAIETGKQLLENLQVGQKVIIEKESDAATIIHHDPAFRPPNLTRQPEKLSDRTGATSTELSVFPK